ncbi:Ldh family oxidoreductase [Nakamurella lactea]|uniref:Ldh family oxidoreductase n=1 Tax=Nakamurella lactea TaxID=459515 RepID=UPI0004187104|nr:Ldh family oxidoreductase [Nakamurella lactea]
MTTRLLDVEELVRRGTTLMVAVGTPVPAAQRVARSLAEANRCGHDSHGVVRIPWYADFVPDGRAVPTAEPVVVNEFGATAVIDGQRCWGQLAGHLACDVAERIVAGTGIAAVTVRSANHVGRLGEYVERLVAKGLVGIMWCNADPAMAPFGGRDRMLGTNPMAIGVPAGDADPMIVDFASAAVAEGKLRLERAAGRSVAPGLIQDGAGGPSTDPEDFYRGGALLPFGLHKGFGLALMIELLGGALSGNHVGFLPEYHWGNGVVLIALAPEAFGDPAVITDEFRRGLQGIRGARPAAGFDEVLAPGDIEKRVREQRDAEGIPVPQEVWEQLSATADRLGVPW